MARFGPSDDPTNPMFLISRQLERAERIIGVATADQLADNLVDMLSDQSTIDAVNNVPPAVAAVNQFQVMSTWLAKLVAVLNSLEYS